MAQKLFDIRPFQYQRFAIVPIFAELVDPDSVGFFRPGRILIIFEKPIYPVDIESGFFRGD